MLRFFMVLTQVASLIAFFMLLAAVADTSAPRSAAYAAIAAVLVLIPYCVTRILYMSKQTDDTQAIYKALLQIRDNQT